MKQTLILAVESSCDETAVAVVADGKEILSNVVATQIDVHKEFGGVIPEVASRIHVENISMVIEEALHKANVVMEDIDAVAVTQGPGLVGCLHIGVQAAKTLAWAFHKPLVPVHHIAGHIYANRLITDLKFPLLALVVSGGHTELVYMNRIAKEGKPMYKLARPKTENPMDFSFSGLKSSVLQFIDRCKRKNETFTAADLAASYQETAFGALLERAEYALQKYHPAQMVLAGGVAANSCLREKVEKGLAEKYKDIEFIIPPLSCCTDNAAMIAVAGYIAYTHGVRGDFDLTADPGIELEEAAQSHA